LGIFDRFTKNDLYQKCVRFQKLVPDFRGDFIQPDEQEWLPDYKHSDGEQAQKQYIKNDSKNKNRYGCKQKQDPCNGGKENRTNVKVAFLWIVLCEAGIDEISIACAYEHKCHEQEKAIAEISGVIC